jgi:tellurite resistance protein TehA-like permease
MVLQPKSGVSMVTTILLRGIVILHDIDRYVFLVFCPIAIVIQIIFILTFLKYKLLKNTPEDIIFALIIVQMVLGACLLADASIFVSS